MSSVKRVSLSVPLELAEDLDYVHRRIGVSKSALVSELIGAGLSDIRALLEAMPDQPTPEDIVRFRGASIEVAESRINEYRQQVDG